MAAARVRGGVAGAAAFVVLSTLVVATLVAVAGEAATEQRLDDPDLLSVVLWVLVGAAAAGGAAVGVWQALAAGADGRAAARIGAAGPLLVAAGGLATDVGDGAVGALASFALSAVGAVAGARFAARRLR